MTFIQRVKSHFTGPAGSSRTPPLPSPAVSLSGPGTGRSAEFDLRAGKLRAVSDKLKGLSRSTEGEFLSIGENLLEAHTGAGDISRIASSVASSMSGEKISDAIQGLRETMDRMDGFLSRAGSETSRDENSLHDIRRILRELKGPLKDFEKVVKFLRNLGIATKIESARMGQECGGFGVVAENVERMSVLFEKKSTSIMKRCADLDSVIFRTLTRVIDHQHGLRERARTILGEAGANLAALVDTHDRCVAAARVISDISTDISRNVGEVVASMQTHDITRQQIEHVTQAIDDLLVKLEDAGSGEEANALAGDVCRLQAAHLGNSRASIVKALESASDNLRGIADNSEGIARRSKEMSGSAGADGRSVLSGVEQGLSLVGSSLRESAGAVREFSAVIRSIAGTVEEMSSFMNDIREIGGEIELVALNAEIKAAHTGSKGAALGVLAESIQHLAVDSRNQRTAVSAALDRIRSAAAAMSSASGMESEGGSRDSEVEEMQASLSGLLESLARINGGIAQPLARLDDGARALSTGIDRVVRGITVHHRVSSVVDEAISELAAVEAEYGRFGSTRHSRTNAGLESLADRYTMSEERHIHRVVMGMGEALPLQTASAGETGSDFGDNVELF